MKKVILFDLDDTLYDYVSLSNKAMNKVYLKIKKRIKISKEDFDKKFKISRDEVHRELSGTAPSHNRVIYFQRLVEKTHNTIDPEAILELYEEYWGYFLKNIRPKEGVIKTLKELKKQGFEIGIVTNLTTHIQLRKIVKLKISEYVDVLVSSEEAGREKPHPSPFLLALNKLDARPADSIMVGDSFTSDVEGANSVGITSIHLDIGSKNKNNIKPDFTIKKISELLNIVKGLNK